MRRALIALAACGAAMALAGASGAVETTQESGATLLPRFFTNGTYGFGSSVALSRNGLAMAVGNPRDDDRGSVTVYTRAVGGAWSKRATFRPSEKQYRFGTSVTISADGRVVLAGVNRGPGGAWIYRNAGGGVWVGQKLVPKDAKSPSFVGYSVALSDSGSTALVGGPGDSSFRGAAWVFTRQGSAWKQQGPKLVGKGEVGADRFGWSVALSGDGSRALIGGPRDRENAGAAWAFARSGSTWRQDGEKLKTPAILGRRQFEFGWDVALSGDGRFALIGAPRLQWTRVKGSQDGAVFPFVRRDTGWGRRARLQSASGIRFGETVDLSPNGSAAVIGSRDRFGTPVAYSCTALDCTPTREPVRPRDDPADPNDQPADGYGIDAAVADDGDAIVVGAPYGQKNKKPAFGQVWTFLRWPTVTDLTPRSGPTSGGTQVRITGENFLKVRRVLFGPNPAPTFAVQSPTLMTAVSPPGEGGVDVQVVTAVGTSPRTGGGWFSTTSTAFFYAPRPVVTSISPSSGPTAGGTTVTITGTGFDFAATVRFGQREATVTGNTGAVITALSPTTGSAGTVDVTVTTTGGTSEASAATKFTYVAPVVEQVINFDNLVTGGPGGGGGPLVQVTNQYAAQGLTFNGPSAIDYSKGTAIPGFARSGTVAIEHCVGVEFCTTPIRGTFSPTKSMVRVWVGFSFQLNQPLQVQLRALNGTGGVLGTASATLPARPTPTPISIPLEVRSPGIAQFEVLVPGGFNNALAVDDVTFEN